jgi:hypothetical protein
MKRQPGRQQHFALLIFILAELLRVDGIANVKSPIVNFRLLHLSGSSSTGFCSFHSICVCCGSEREKMYRMCEKSVRSKLQGHIYGIISQRYFN